MLTLRQMLSERVEDDVPPWGTHGFPYRCGVTEQDIRLWASDFEAGGFVTPLRQSPTVGTVLKTFCGDCPLSVQRAAQARGACIKPIVDSYKAGGRAPETEIANAYIAGTPVEELCATYGVSPRTIYRIINRRHPAPVRTRQRAAVAQA